MPKPHNLNSMFDSQVPHDGSRELAPSRCPLTSTHIKQKCNITTIKGKKRRRRKAVLRWIVPHPHPLTLAFPCTPEPFQPEGLSSDCSCRHLHASHTDSALLGCCLLSGSILTTDAPTASFPTFPASPAPPGPQHTPEETYFHVQ